MQDQGLSRQAGENPLFDVTFFEVTPTSPGAATRWSPRHDVVPAGVVTAKQALALGVLHDAEGTEVSLTYDTSRVDAGAVERLASHLQVLVQDGVLHPDRRLSQLDLLTAAEHANLAAWNDTAAAGPADRCTHELFAAQARRTPTAVALVFGEQRLTYQELDERSNQLAHHLRGLGVGPEVLVALCVERSLEMVVGLLGILKAGGAYVPLDPSYPRERLAFMLTDARPAVLLTQARLRDSLPPHAVVTVHLDADAPAWQEPHTPLAVPVRPDHASYVLYTSGSTGRPKGVQILHAALTNLLHAFAEQTKIGPHDVLLAVTSMSFDIAGLELFMPLIRGASIHLASRDDASDGEALVRALERATMMQATPATWRMVLDAGWTGERPCRRCAAERP
ncbi:AMP-binding protein [Nannocystis pusilla]|uniref:AMP-binding protein n=1 Tax=Nannocystis pusilla TaxID=889268 RepID=A0A9X3F0D2_9BACT|nr:AMP-binding protein [Nannocystis pusilla]